ncbi:putative transposase [Aquimonas voraii]|uniref:Putative transposase n=1 Tax=Aquimonas voraii TaxID=265719 RepID=A0A1G7A0U6_9GAMM|nr:putative transposase [Aquimonas voraii]
MHSDDHLLRCYCSIEVNPVRARRVSQAGEHAGSSDAANAQGAIDPRVSPHPRSLALHAEDMASHRLYREWVQSAITPNEVAPDEVDEIRQRLEYRHAFETVRLRRRIQFRIATRFLRASAKTS